jgi:hypothetical protein
MEPGCCYCVVACYSSSISPGSTLQNSPPHLATQRDPSRPADRVRCQISPAVAQVHSSTQCQNRAATANSSSTAATTPTSQPSPSARSGGARAALKHRACPRNALALQDYWLSGFLSDLARKRLAAVVKQTILGSTTFALAILDESQTAKQPPACPVVARQAPVASSELQTIGSTLQPPCPTSCFGSSQV